MKKISFIIITILISMFWSNLFAQSKSFKIIVNNSNTLESITSAKLSKIFFKKQTLWDNGKKIQPVDQKKENAVRDNFAQDIQNKSTDAISAYWRKQIFSGRGIPPIEKPSDADVIAYVKNNSDAIGYVSNSAKVSGVKVITLKK